MKQAFYDKFILFKPLFDLLILLSLQAGLSEKLKATFFKASKMYIYLTEKLSTFSRNVFIDTYKNKYYIKYVTLTVSGQTDDVKETNTVYFSISFYIVNQMPMSPGTNFHCQTTRSACSSG